MNDESRPTMGGFLRLDLCLLDGCGDDPGGAVLVISIIKNKSLTTDRVQIMIVRVDKRKTERESR